MEMKSLYHQNIAQHMIGSFVTAYIVTIDLATKGLMDEV